MENSDIKCISADIAIGKIVETIKQASPGEAPFTLVVGAGFSHPYIPTAADFVYNFLPLFDKSFVPKSYPAIPTPRFAGQILEWQRLQEQRAKEELDCRAAAFWGKFLEANKSNHWQLELDRRGIPHDFRSAYKYAFHDKSVWPFQNKAEQRKYLLQVIKPNRFRLNDAHFMLASILGAQSGKGAANKVQSESSLFKFQAAFSRCILTTNFDHFLQIALQAVNRLYFMSDTPELVSEDLTDEQTDAIHLIYVHGSIHRHRQDNNDEQINERKEIAEDLVPVLKKNGIIIIGYNGWDDTIVEALSKCKEFSSHGLYWVDLQLNPLGKGAFGAQVPEILRKPNAYYVQAKAGLFMNRLHTLLVNGLPRLLQNPIAQIREMLTIIDFGELEVLEAGVGVALKDTTPIPKNLLGKSTFKDFKNLTLQNLKTAEDFFIKHRDSASLEILARYSFNAGKGAETIEFCNKGLARNSPSGEQAVFYELRAYALMQTDKLDAAIRDLNRVIEEMSEVPIDRRMDCLRWRATIRFEKGEYNLTVTDLTTLIRSNGDPDQDHQVNLHFWRANAWEKMGGKDNVCRAIVDYNYIIKLPYRSPPNEKERAYYNRARMWSEIKQYDRALVDYTRVIDLAKSCLRANVNADLVAMALCNRGYTFGWLGKTGKALADFEEVINNLPNVGIQQMDGPKVFNSASDVSDERKADALSCRGWLFYTQNDFENCLQDLESSLQKLPTAHHAMYHLGLALLANDRDADALAAYQRAAKQYPNLIEEYGLTDLKDAMSKWLTPERAKPSVDLLESLKKDSAFNG